MNDDDTFTISIGDSTYTNTSTIDISNITTVTDDSITFSNTFDTSTYDGTFTTDSTYDWSINNYIDPEEVECMCKEYPALAKVWQNFKSVYDMVQQDYKGKKEAGEINDPIPF